MCIPIPTLYPLQSPSQHPPPPPPVPLPGLPDSRTLPSPSRTPHYVSSIGYHISGPLLGDPMAPLWCQGGAVTLCEDVPHDWGIMR